MKAPTLLFFIFIHIIALGQPKPNYLLYNHALKAPDKVSHSPEELVAYLCTVTQSKKETAEVIAYWIASHISYDIDAFVSKKYQIESWQKVLTSRLAICGGYSTLYQKLCETAGIQAFIVAGYVRTADLNNKDGFKETNHVWNVFKISNSYHLVDITFASGFIRKSEEQYQFIRKLTQKNIFVDPEKFIEDHLTAQQRWQLLAKPVTMYEFLDIDNTSLSSVSNQYHYVDSINAYTKLDSSNQMLKDALDAYEVNPLPLELAWIYEKVANDIAVTDSEKSELKKAMQYYKNAIHIYQADSSKTSQRHVRNSLNGIAYVKQLLQRGSRRRQ